MATKIKGANQSDNLPRKRLNDAGGSFCLMDGQPWEVDKGLLAQQLLWISSKRE